MGVRVVKLVQNPRDFIVSFPQAYHMGFSFGYHTHRPPGSSHGLPPRLPPLTAATAARRYVNTLLVACDTSCTALRHKLRCVQHSACTCMRLPRQMELHGGDQLRYGRLAPVRRDGARTILCYGAIPRLASVTHSSASIALRCSDGQCEQASSSCV
jgi:hypothetical protein